MANVFGCDFGSSLFHVCRNKDLKTYEKFEPNQFIQLPFANAGDIVLIELAHVQPQKTDPNSSISLSQGLTYENLLTLKEASERKGVVFRLVPHSLTPRLRHEFFPGQDKSDQIDAAVIGHFYDIYGLDGLQHFQPKPPNTFSPSQELAFKIKAETDAVLNYFRGHAGDYTALKKVRVLSDYLNDNKKIVNGRWGMFADNYDWAILFEKWIAGRSKGAKKMKDASENSVFASLWVCVYAVDGSLRVNPRTGKPLGINFLWKQVLGNRPNHFRGGVARSNLMYHGFKTRVLPKRLQKVNGQKVALSKTNKNRQELNELRREYSAVCKTTLRKIQELKL